MCRLSCSLRPFQPHPLGGLSSSTTHCPQKVSWLCFILWNSSQCPSMVPSSFSLTHLFHQLDIFWNQKSPHYLDTPPSPRKNHCTTAVVKLIFYMSQIYIKGRGSEYAEMRPSGGGARGEMNSRVGFQPHDASAPVWAEIYLFFEKMRETPFFWFFGGLEKINKIHRNCVKSKWAPPPKNEWMGSLKSFAAPLAVDLGAFTCFWGDIMPN